MKIAKLFTKEKRRTLAESVACAFVIVVQIPSREYAAFWVGMFIHVHVSSKSENS